VLTVNVGANSPPDSAGKHLLTSEGDTPLALVTADFAATDADAGQTLANVRIDSVPVNSGLLLNLWQWWQGKVVSAADAAKTIWALRQRFGTTMARATPALTSRCRFSGAHSTMERTITFNVTPVNDAPVANADHYDDGRRPFDDCTRALLITTRI
jgi:hypothetical protein